MSPEAWALASTIASAAATVALTLFAAAELIRASKQEKARALTAATRASAIAYAIRRQLLSWLAGPEDDADNLDSWLRRALNSGSYATHIAAAEQRFTDLLEAIAEAPPSSSIKARQAYVLFLAGTQRLNEYVATPRPDGVAFMDWLQLRIDAAKDFRDTLRELEAGPITPDLLNAATILERTRDEEDPLRASLGAARQRKLPGDRPRAG